MRISAQGHSFGACSEFTAGSVLGALAGAASQEETNESAGNIDVAVVERIAEMSAP